MRAIYQTNPINPFFQSSGTQRGFGRLEGRGLAQVCELLLGGGIHEYERDGSSYLHRLETRRIDPERQDAALGNSRKLPRSRSSQCGPGRVQQPWFETVRSDPHFQDLLCHIGFPSLDSVPHFKRAPQGSGVPLFSLKNSVYSRGCSAGSNHCTSSDKILYTAARDEEYVLGQDWNICSFAAQEGLQGHW